MRLPRTRSLLSLALLTVLTAAAHAQFKAGLTTRIFHPQAERNWRGSEHHELDVTLWYPAPVDTVETPQTIGPPDAPLFLAGSAAPHAAFAPALDKLPLILLSHGTGGSALQLAWLGTALARAGYIAAAVNHPGNNATEPYTPEGFALWWERATDLSEVLDGMLADPELGPRIDRTRIGAAGFSIGGYTVLALGGARTDISVLTDLCHTDPQTPVCHVPEMKGMGSPDDVLRQVRKTSAVSLASSAESFRDPRIHAVFAIAPAVGMTLTRDSLHSMRLPVEIAVGSADPIAPPRDNADYIRSNIRGARETVLPNVVHYTFLDTCTPAGKAQLGVYCADNPGVDREAIHQQVDDLAIRFFDKALRMH